VIHDDLVAAIVTPNAVDAEIAVSLLNDNGVGAQSFGTVSAFA
jgi:hypothetical protein